jgi:hypothetical protein
MDGSTPGRVARAKNAIAMTVTCETVTDESID